MAELLLWMPEFDMLVPEISTPKIRSELERAMGVLLCSVDSCKEFIYFSYPVFPDN